MSILLQMASGGNSGGSSYSMLIAMVAVFALMYFMMIRPQKKRQKEEQEMRSSVEIGDEIKYSSNGKEVSYIVSGFSQLSNNLDIVIETGADRTKIKFQRWAINTNKTKMEQRQKEVEAARKAAKDKKAGKKSKDDSKAEEPKVSTDEEK